MGSSSGSKPEAEPPRPQTGSSILAVFCSRWEKTEKKPFFKAQFDDRIAHDMAEAINAISDQAKRAAAWADIVPAIERYMGDTRPFYSGHSFEKFAKNLAELRSDRSGSKPPPQQSPAVEKARQQWAGR